MQGNFIGTDVSGLVRLDNFNGVIVRGASDGIAGNLISGNTEAGVLLDVATATGNAILPNATVPLLVDFYRVDVDDQEGEVYLGTLSYDAGDLAAGNTSEFSGGSATVVVPEPAAPNATKVGVRAGTGARRPRPTRRSRSRPSG